MKHTKKLLALLMAVLMVVALAVPAFAADPVDGGDGSTTDTTDTTDTAATGNGSITINSPVVSATYKIYKVFDMTTDSTETSFSYTIDENNPFYGAVVAYASDTTKGLKLSRIAGSTPATYNVEVSTADKPIKINDTTNYGNFDAQAFGTAMQAVLTAGSPAVTADADKGIVAKAAGGAAISEDKSKVAAVDDAKQLKFENLELGYYLINPTYPGSSYGTVTLGTNQFTVEDLEKNADGSVKDPLELNDAAKAAIATYAENTVDDTYVNNYITDNGITTNKDGTPLNDTGKAEYKADLIASMKADAESKVLNAFANKLAGSESDINVKNEPLLVFLDSSKPDAVINEKNELDKWDVPVNPEGDTEPGTPDHGEPNGGKNIVVQENPAYYADWSEAEIGESVHYQLRVNAMNFINTSTGTTKDDTAVEQVKEYILADFQSGHMHFDESKGLHVSIWQGNNSNDSQTGMENVTNTTDAAIAGLTDIKTGTDDKGAYLDYTDYAMGDPANAFFKNGTDNDAKAGDYSKDNSIFDVDDSVNAGIVVPWVIVSQDDLSATYPVYTQTNVPKVQDGQPVYKTEDFKLDADGNPVKATTASGNEIPGQFVSASGKIVNAQKQLLDENNQPIQDYETYYVYSIYSSDVTIVVDYWMILDDDAIVDEPGNKNFAQYGWSPVDNKNNDGTPKQPENPSDEDEPSKKEDVDEATVYTFALAWVKVDNKGNSLANAEFQLPFYVWVDEDGGPTDEGTYVYAFETVPNPAPTDKAYSNKVTTDETGVITIKGVEQAKYSITETKAPDGFNKLTDPFTVEAKKSGTTTTVTTKTTIYLDPQGNVTDTTTTTKIEYTTDEDSYNNSDNSTDEKSVPVYQFDPIVNNKGTELPSTGGIGTTIFYVVGGLLVAAAAILLITKKRMEGEEA